MCVCVGSEWCVCVCREGNDPADKREMSYQELLKEVCRLSNCLKKLGVKKGDRVGIYLPMVLELVVSMLACARIGAIHSIVVSCLVTCVFCCLGDMFVCLFVC